VGAFVGGAEWDSPEAIALIRYYLDAATPVSPEAPETNPDVIRTSAP
jgi:hypothetical protein